MPTGGLPGNPHPLHVTPAMVYFYLSISISISIYRRHLRLHLRRKHTWKRDSNSWHLPWAVRVGLTQEWSSTRVRKSALIGNQNLFAENEPGNAILTPDICPQGGCPATLIRCTWRRRWWRWSTIYTPASRCSAWRRSRGGRTRRLWSRASSWAAERWPRWILS